ncbi:NAD(P)/FAD-dependent oxidoreductase [Clostridium sp. D2Q-11]|uniref:NAD(P)/FAD-dependent oxidoreductase n=1 Tax=Anaeromonas frigoriresistens TaxID=2683708 RepID=A0A942V0Y7_9FIRM|nr:NAD(P)/FAD-dependent oxidoreductase [Anaeromonas frigoriresistens]MBS4539172.1 NAD(P)/FAD-dependent oxidoreductase [Anaeromonas frigoriresistens]
MDVGIIGAGLSGLCCAITLEKHGINPIVYESREEVCDRFINCEIFMHVQTHPIKDVFKFFSEELDIFLQPISKLDELVIHSPNNKSKLTGDIGFSSVRGRHNLALSKQLEKQYKGKIIFNSKYSYEEIQERHTHIIVAPGDGKYSEKLNNYTTDLTVSLKGAIVEGNFNKNTTVAWLNNDFAPKGYGYFIPLSDDKANIVLAYPEYDENKELNMDELWNVFIKRARKDLNQSLKKIDGFQIRNYYLGKCIKPRVGNTFFVGNCFGIMPFLGFGQFTSILTGVYAAYDILGIGNYEKLVKDLEKSYKNSLVLRRGLEKLDNKKLDTLVNSIDGKVGKIIFNNKIDYLSVFSNILKPIIDERG